MPITKKSTTWNRRSEGQRKRWAKAKGVLPEKVKRVTKAPFDYALDGSHNTTDHIPEVLEQLKKEEKTLMDRLQVVRDLIAAIQMFQGLK